MTNKPINPYTHRGHWYLFSYHSFLQFIFYYHLHQLSGNVIGRCVLLIDYKLLRKNNIPRFTAFTHIWTYIFCKECVYTVQLHYFMNAVADDLYAMLGVKVVDSVWLDDGIIKRMERIIIYEILRSNNTNKFYNFLFPD